MILPRQGARCGFDILQLDIDARIVGVYEHGYGGGFWYERVQDLQTFCFQLLIEGNDTRDVAARSIEARDKSEPDGSSPVTNTIGIVEVAALAARMAGTAPTAAINATGRRTSSAAWPGRWSY